MHRREFIRKSSKLIVGAGLTAVAGPLIITPAQACNEVVTTDPLAQLDFTNFDVISWQSNDYDGHTHRLVRERPPYLRFRLKASQGGVDVALRAKQPLNDISDPAFLNSGYYMEATYGLYDATEEDGEWWCGLKFEINYGAAYPPGRFESYVIERSNRDQDAWRLSFEALPDTETIGTTTHNGGVYTHYTRLKTDGETTWTQLFAIRDQYRKGGPVSVTDVISFWLSTVIPSGVPMGYPRFIIEHEGAGNRIFQIKDAYWPPSIT